MDISMISISNDIPIYLCQNVVCRLCGCTGNNNSFILLKENHNFIHLIKKETNVMIKEDDVLPRTVCRTCIEKVEMIEHFKSHCTRTQKVLSTMFDNKESTASFEINDEQNDMVEEWLDEEYNEFKKTKSEITKNNILNSKSYGVLYTDTKTFKNVRVNVCQTEFYKNAPIVPYKILGREKRERVKVVSCEETSEKLTENNSNENDIKIESNDNLSDTMYLQINERTDTTPALYRIITDHKQTNSDIEETEINDNICNNSIDINVAGIGSKRLREVKVYKNVKNSRRRLSCIESKICIKKEEILDNM